MAAWSRAGSRAIAKADSLCPRVYLSRWGAGSRLTGRGTSEELELAGSVDSLLGEVQCAAGRPWLAPVSSGELMAAGGQFVHGSREALETRPFETVPQRIGRPFPYGEAPRRADMLEQNLNNRAHRTPKGVHDQQLVSFL